MTTQSSSYDPYNLQRFLDAQESTYEQARSELSAGQKRSHWMWFIFPQIRGLGSSSMAEQFAIGDMKEAMAYLEHPVLGSRLRECTGLVNAIPQRSVSEIFGYPDELKFHSSVTLFSEASKGFSLENNVFSQAIAKYFEGKLDSATLDRLRF
jgi:uncharacterized protein (DUF1810 family)